jgi:hypothetical protein
VTNMLRVKSGLDAVSNGYFCRLEMVQVIALRI